MMYVIFIGHVLDVNGSVLMARLTRAQQQERTRGRVLLAARQVFEAKGFVAATLEEVAELAEVTRGAIYPQFGGKAGLLRAVLESVAVGQLERWQSLSAEELTDERRIEAIGQLIAAEARAVGELRRAVREYAALGIADDDASKDVDATVRPFEAAVQQMCDKLGARAPLSPKDFAVVVRALVNGLWGAYDEDPSIDIARLFSTSFALLLTPVDEIEPVARGTKTRPRAR